MEFTNLTGFTKSCPEIADKVIDLHDSAIEVDCGENQILINGLAALLEDIETSPEHDDVDSFISSSRMNYMLSLSAAYDLGKKSANAINSEHAFG